VDLYAGFVVAQRILKESCPDVIAVAGSEQLTHELLKSAIDSKLCGEASQLLPKRSPIGSRPASGEISACGILRRYLGGSTASPHA
jgi:hypothetical protein